jgi:hypothetical protein
MTGWQVDSSGVCIVSDFQTLAGAAVDWEPGLTPLTQSTLDTNIYSILVNIPANRKYEFKFVNAQHWYGVEFVPEESRVIYNFNDNRWFYLDSLADDTTLLGAIPFSGNAPVGKKLLRFRVNMRNEIVSNNNVHIVGDFQNWNYAATTMYSFDGQMYEYIAYVDSGNQFYRFVNGNTMANAETVPLPCVTNNSRVYWAEMDIIMNTVCFGACTECLNVGINENAISQFQLYPNPTSDHSTLVFGDMNLKNQVFVRDITGKVIRTYPLENRQLLTLEKENLTSGLYFVQVVSNKQNVMLKWWVNN